MRSLGLSNAFSSRRVFLAWGLALGLATLPCGAARADGGYFLHHDDVAMGQVASIDSQRAVIWFRPNTIEFQVETRSSGDAPRFYWILPLPAKPDSVLEAHALFVDQLDKFTAPALYCPGKCFPPQYSSSGDVVEGGTGDHPDVAKGSMPVTVFSAGNVGNLS